MPIEFSVKSGAVEKQKSACLVVGVYDARKLSPAAQQIDENSGGTLSRIIRRGDLEGKIGQTLLLHEVQNVGAERVLLVGCGKEKELDENNYRKICAKAARLLNETGSTEMTACFSELDVKHRNTHWKIRQATETIQDALYRFDTLKSDINETRRPLKRVVYMVNKRVDLEDGELAIQQGQAIGRGLRLAKDLGNLPGNICTPSYLADESKKLQDQYNIKTSVLEEEEMKELGMGALLSVSLGSREPAKLIIIEYRAGKDSEAPVVLVGKGLTFDAGGISIKPAAAMDEMKYDMCGGASVLGTIMAVAEMKLPINLIGVVPSSENLPDGAANKPGDIVTSMSGQTIEILNTDAEGRLILCDALTYVERFKPALVIDIATLTGACVVALGSHATGLLSNNDSLARDLVHAGNDAFDRAWRLPLWNDYDKQLESNFADMANIGGRGAGTITAACFLARYTKKYKWAHLDIAGTAWKKGKTKGSTGRPVPLLCQFLINRYQKQKDQQ